MFWSQPNPWANIIDRSPLPATLTLLRSMVLNVFLLGLILANEGTKT
jgi:hypothetical protein